jgi:prepilin-type N-terminal cleavage/methylation domain-containing protein
MNVHCNGRPESRFAGQRGFSLLEILITLFLLTMWLLASAGVQSASLQFNKAAQFRTQAVYFATDLAERMQANDRVDSRQLRYAGDTLAPVSCTTRLAPDLAAFDLGNGAPGQGGLAKRHVTVHRHVGNPSLTDRRDLGRSPHGPDYRRPARPNHFPIRPKRSSIPRPCDHATTPAAENAPAVRALAHRADGRLTIGLMIVAPCSPTSTRLGSEPYQRAPGPNTRPTAAAADFLRHGSACGLRRVSWTNPRRAGSDRHDRLRLRHFAANIAQPSGAPTTRTRFRDCIPSANYARGDILVLRRAGLDLIPTTTVLSANTLYFRSEYLQGSVYVGPTRPANLQTPVADYLLETDVYYISPWTTSQAESPQVPALYRMTLGTGPAMSAQLIASGIENMQVQYGVSTDIGIRFYDASTVPASLWTSVPAVRLWLLARSTTAEPGNVSTARVHDGRQDVPTARHPERWLQRQLFPLVVQIRK